MTSDNVPFLRRLARYYLWLVAIVYLLGGILAAIYYSQLIHVTLLQDNFFHKNAIVTCCPMMGDPNLLFDVLGVFLFVLPVHGIGTIVLAGVAIVAGAALVGGWFVSAIGLPLFAGTNTFYGLGLAALSIFFGTLGIVGLLRLRHSRTWIYGLYCLALAAFVSAAFSAYTGLAAQSYSLDWVSRLSSIHPLNLLFAVFLLGAILIVRRDLSTDQSVGAN